MENRQNTSTLLEQLDLYSIVRDVLRNLWVILLAALAVGMIVYMGIRAQSKNTYTTRATFVVTSKTSGNYTYSNLSAASTMAFAMRLPRYGSSPEPSLIRPQRGSTEMSHMGL